MVVGSTTAAAPRRSVRSWRAPWSGIGRLADAPLDRRHQLLLPHRLHQRLVPLRPAARHLEQIAAHNEGVGAEMRRRLGDHGAIAVRKPPVGNYQRIGLGIEYCHAAATVSATSTA